MHLGDTAPDSVGADDEMYLRVLGPIEVVAGDGSPVALGGRAQVKLLSLLAASPQPVAVCDIIVEIWNGSDLPADPVAAIRTYVARLRQAIGAASIVTGTGSYALGPVRTDADRFEALIGQARAAGGAPSAASLWRAALELWRGPAYGEYADIDLVRPRGQRLEELRTEATEAWIESRIVAGQGREVVADVVAAIELHPLSETLQVHLLTVLARAGRQAEALRAFQSFRANLAELGLEPSPRLVALDATIARGDVPVEPMIRVRQPRGRCTRCRVPRSTGPSLPHSMLPLLRRPA